MAQVFCRGRAIKVVFKGAQAGAVGEVLGVTDASQAFFTCHRRGPHRLLVVRAAGAAREVTLRLYQTADGDTLRGCYNQIALPHAGLTRNAFTRVPAEGIATTRLGDQRCDNAARGAAEVRVRQNGAPAFDAVREILVA